MKNLLLISACAFYLASCSETSTGAPETDSQAQETNMPTPSLPRKRLPRARIIRPLLETTTQRAFIGAIRICTQNCPKTHLHLA